MALEKLFSDDPRGYLLLVDYSVIFLAIIANTLVLDGLLNFNNRRNNYNSNNSGGGNNFGHFHLFGYRRFFVSLVVSDLYLCIVNLIAIIYTIIAKYQDSYREMCIPVKLRSMYHVAFVANLLSLMAMSADHLVGIVWSSIYRKVMTNRVVICILLFIWIGSHAFGLVDYCNAIAIYLKIRFNEPEATKHLNPQLKNDFLLSLSRRSTADNFLFENLTAIANYTGSNTTLHNGVIIADPAALEQWKSFAFCLLYTVSQPWLVEALLILALICFIFLIISYAIIFKEILKKLSIGNASVNIATIIATTVLLIVAFVVCWLPLTIFEFVSNAYPDETASFFGGAEQMLELCLYSVFQSYPLFDAIICTLRLRKVRKYIVHKYCRLLCPCCHRNLGMNNEYNEDPAALALNNNTDDAGYELSEL